MGKPDRAVCAALGKRQVTPCKLVMGALIIPARLSTPRFCPAAAPSPSFQKV